MSNKNEIADLRREFEQKWLEYYEATFIYVLRKVRNKADAEDITQITFQRFLAHMERVQWKTEVKNLRAYLMSAAANLCVDFLNRNIEETQVSYDDQADEQTRNDLRDQAIQRDDSYTRIEARIFYEELYKSLPLEVILSRLSEYELNLLHLHAVEELTAEEIAKIVDNDVRQVRYDLQKLYAKIRYRARKLFLPQLTIDGEQIRREQIRARFRNKFEGTTSLNLKKRIRPIDPVRPKNEAEHESWLSLSRKRLVDAYGEDEEEYSLDSITEANPEYEGR